jgi:hypothetical protein
LFAAGLKLMRPLVTSHPCCIGRQAMENLCQTGSCSCLISNGNHPVDASMPA